MQSDARHGAELCVADNTPPCKVRQSKAERRHNGQVSEFTKMNHSTEPQKDGESSLRLEGRSHGVKRTLERYASESSQVPTHLETPRESALGQKAVD